MKRKIITIDEDLCNGCGQCVTACAEGALQIVNGKAKLIKEDFCDGLGACIGECPTGALKIEEREAADYDPVATRAHLVARGDLETLRRFDEAAALHAAAHGGGHPPTPPKPERSGEAHQPIAPPSHRSTHSTHHAPQHFAAPTGGCPGLRVRSFEPAGPAPTPTGAGLPSQINPSELRQWPIQLHLVPPSAPFFDGKELVVMSTCGPLASADVHWRFLRGRSVVVACPKLDRTEPYVDKLAAILSRLTIPRAIVVRMEVPCCGGLTRMVADAARLTGRTDLIVEETTLSLDGAVLKSERIL